MASAPSNDGGVAVTVVPALPLHTGGAASAAVGPAGLNTRSRAASLAAAAIALNIPAPEHTLLTRPAAAQAPVPEPAHPSFQAGQQRRGSGAAGCGLLLRRFLRDHAEHAR